ncbi:hypothetical protein HMPREF1989_01406 [Porphyromonas gingivalis F0566]|uniref:DUF3667 domain-containing protein n=1 Tax=Porphyromonas gingivalis TaxID=837 RepID=UPI0003AD34BD|nr:DUF3667 domain-containing protein [Porphyromonas gingivalis]ERJ86081.1 hypothetical protein HMPREF1989_01406 [Porphyromonas gingivalis F0566]
MQTSSKTKKKTEGSRDSTSKKQKNGEHGHSERKMANSLQILMLASLLWLAIEDLATSGQWGISAITGLAFWAILRKRRLLPRKIDQRLQSLLFPLRVRIRAFELRLMRGRATPPADPYIHICQNCGDGYTGNFCNRCGQTSRTGRYHFRQMIRNVIGGFTNIDSGFGRTIVELLYRPGYLIRDFIGGKRVVYFRPFQALFVLASLYIIFAQLIGPDPLQKKPIGEELTRQEYRMDQKEISSLQKENKAVGSDSGEMIAERHTGRRAFFYKQMRFVTEQKNRLKSLPFFSRIWSLLMEWFQGNKAVRIISILPILAVSTKAAFRQKGAGAYNLTEHIIAQAYIACQLLLLNVLALPFYSDARVGSLYGLPALLLFLLFCWDYKQLFLCSWWWSFWRTILVVVYCLLFLALTTSLIAVVIVAIEAVGRAS